MRLEVNQVIGHRGAAAYAPENTLAAFNHARSLGCHWIEFDVQLSADGQLFVFHDAMLDRTTNGKGPFVMASAEELRRLDAGAWFSSAFRGVHIPTFQETLAWLIETETMANIEIKANAETAKTLTTAVLSTLNAHWPSTIPLPLISSFEYDALELCHQLAPEMPLGLLLPEWREDWLSLARAINCFSVHLNSKWVTAKRVQHIKESGYRVFAYTVNRRSQARRLFACGIDAIFSDYPDVMTRTFFDVFKSKIQP